MSWLEAYCGLGNEKARKPHELNPYGEGDGGAAKEEAATIPAKQFIQCMAGAFGTKAGVIPPDLQAEIDADRAAQMAEAAQAA